MTNWWTGISSIAVTPSLVRWLVIAGWARPAYVPRISSGTLGVQLGQALHVRLVDQALVVGDVEAPVALPVEERVDDHAVLHVGGGVVVVAGVGVAEVVAEQRLVPVDRAGGGLGVGVEQQLVGVAAQPALWVVRAVHAVAVALPRLHGRQVAVPDEPVDLGQLDARLVAAGAVEQAQLDPLGDLAEQREVRAAAVEGGAQGVRRARPALHAVAHFRQGSHLERSKHTRESAPSSAGGTHARA